MDEWRKQKGEKEKQRIRWEENSRAAGRRKGGGREEVNQLSEAVLQCYTSAFRESSGSNRLARAGVKHPDYLQEERVAQVQKPHVA